MIESASLQAIPQVLHRLSGLPANDKVLSVHLDTTPNRTMGEAHRIWLRDSCRALAETLRETDPGERRQLDAAIQEAEQYVSGHVVTDHPGLAIYVAGSGALGIAVPLPHEPRDRVAWSAHPMIEPLVTALDDHARMAVLLFDKQRNRLFTIFLGAIEERHTFVDEVPGKQATGDWFGLSQARYARHHEDHVLRHVKRTIQLLTEELERHPYERLVIGGPDEARQMLVQHLPRPLLDRLAGIVSLELFATEGEIRNVALRAAEAAERREEMAAIRALLDRSSAQSAVVGLDATLGVLSDGRVHLLFVADTLESGGAECERCRRLVSQDGACPMCRNETTPVPHIGDRAVAYALAQGARVEIVSSEAAGTLQAHGGLGAWARY